MTFRLIIRTFPSIKETSMPRETTLALLQLLKEELGLTIRSTFEMEFGIRHADVGKQFGHESNLANLVATQSSGVCIRLI